MNIDEKIAVYSAQFDQDVIGCVQYINLVRKEVSEERPDIEEQIDKIMFLYGGDVESEDTEEFAILLDTMFVSADSADDIAEQLEELYNNEIDRLF